MAAAHRSAVLSTYKRLLELSRRLDVEEGARAAAAVRGGFRVGAGERDPAAAAALLADARSRLAFLRMRTPRRAGDGEAVRGYSGGGGGGGGGGSGAAAAGAAGAAVRGGGRFVVRGGVVTEVEAGADVGVRGRAAVNGYVEGNLDPDAVRRHEASMRRFRFMDRPPGGRPR
jgi:hypothetical protein